MNLIFYSSLAEQEGKRLEGLLETLMPQDKLKVYRTIDKLSHSLQNWRSNFRFAILLASNREEILDFLSIRSFIKNSFVILVLPDRQRESIELGYQLSPLLLFFQDSDFVEIKPFLERILARTTGYLPDSDPLLFLWGEIEEFSGSQGPRIENSFSVADLKRFRQSVQEVNF